MALGPAKGLSLSPNVKSLIIKNFKYGLDTRRDVLTSQPGTLVTLENCHINQGAEIESRKAFVPVGTLPSNCFDLLATPTGLVTFGSASRGAAGTTYTTTFRARLANVVQLTITPASTIQAGDYVSVAGVGGTGYNVTSALVTFVGGGGTTILYANVGANETIVADGGGTVTILPLATVAGYQRLQHPWVSIINDGLLSPTMSGVKTSCCFNGNTFVAASFNAFTGSIVSSDWSTNATTILYSNGVPIVDHWLGVVLAKSGFRSGAVTDQWVQMAKNLANEIPSYFGTTFSGLFVNPSFTQISGPVSQSFALTASFVTTTANTFTVDTTHQAAATNATVAVGAVCTFFLVGGSGGQINSLIDYAGYALISAPVPFDSSLVKTAQDLANAITTNNPAIGNPISYTAVASQVSTTIAQIIVTAPTTSGSAPNGQNITINSTTIKVSNNSSGGATGVQSFPFSGGVTRADATPQISYTLFDRNGVLSGWNYNDTWTLIVVSNNVQYTVGAGNIANLIPTYCLALGSKVNIISGTTWAFSAISDDTKWEKQDVGAGTITIADQSFSPTSIVSLATYQGRMAVFCRSNIQIWTINADPTLYTQGQILQNTGTFAGLSVQSLGDLDVLYLSDTGIRSLRARETSLNAFVTDIGSPIDQIITDSLLVGGSNTTACSVVEPISNRYWLHLNGVIYVLSYFPSLKISAWSTYKPTYITNLGSPNAGSFQYTTIPGATYYWQVGNANTIQQSGGANCNPGINGQFVATGAFVTVTTSTLGGNAPPFTSVLYEATPFTPVKFVVYNGQVYVLDTNNRVYVFGGSNNNTYDGSVSTVETPWLDDKEPTAEKRLESLSYAAAGLWYYQMSTDILGGTIQNVSVKGQATPAIITDSSFPYTGKIGVSGISTHIKIKALSDVTNQGKLVLGCLAVNYKEGRER